MTETAKDKTVTTYTLDFAYDAQGAPYSITVTLSRIAQTYYYITNLQGDVMYLLDTAGNTVAAYDYDPYGKIIGTNDYSTQTFAQIPTEPEDTTKTLADLNPLRYRGYYYDTDDLGFYYLQSRYYDADTCRFISADSYTVSDREFSGYNMFAYCGNNPASRTDSGGDSWWGWVAAVAVVAVCAVAVVATAGGAAAAVTAVTAVANGCAATTCASTIAAGAFIGSSTALAGSVVLAASESESLDEFASYGTGAFFSTMTGGAYGALQASTLNAGNCFIAGTLVQTEDGEAAIEKIEAGDSVWAWEETTDAVALKQVVETYVNETDELVHVFVNGEEIVTTPTHPFYSPVKGWTNAVHLRAGDMLVLVNGEYVVVEKVQHELLENPVKVYNFQVADYHTYYVSESGVLVHNKCPNPNGKKGSQAHQDTVQEVGNDLQNRGYDVKYEYRVDTTGGYKNTRYVDVYATNGSDSIGVQVGRMTTSGQPVARERRALADLIGAGMNVIFMRY